MVIYCNWFACHFLDYDAVIFSFPDRYDDVWSPFRKEIWAGDDVVSNVSAGDDMVSNVSAGDDMAWNVSAGLKWHGVTKMGMPTATSAEIGCVNMTQKLLCCSIIIFLDQKFNARYIQKKIFF